jgi:hypothetical protein
MRSDITACEQVILVCNNPVFFDFFLQLSSETFLIVRKAQRDATTKAQSTRISTRYSCQILMKLEFSKQFFERKKNTQNIRFHENPSSYSRVAPCGQTDMTKLTVAFVQLCERA